MRGTTKDKAHPAPTQCTAGARRSTRIRHGAFMLRCLAVSALALGLASSWSGEDRYDYDPLGRLVRHVDPAGRVTQYQYDAAGNILSVGPPDGTALAGAPALNALSPDLIRRGDTRSITLAGQGLRVGTLRASDPGLDLSQVQQQLNEIRAQLSVASTTPTGEQALVFSNSLGSARIAVKVGPALPQLSLEPNPLALPPDNRPHAITIRLSGADVVSHEVSITSSDTTRLGVTPGRVTLEAGATSAQVQVRPVASGFANLTLASPQLGTLTVPVFITSDFRGVNTSYARPVGVSVGPAVRVEPPPSVPVAVPAPGVGVAVGAVLTGVTPRAMTVGARAVFTVTGHGLPAGMRVSVLPSQGVDIALDAQAGNEARLTITAQDSAAAGSRRLLFTDASGRPLPFADPGQGLIELTTGQPVIDSIDPLFARPGTTPELIVRGRHLSGTRLVVTPGIDLQVDTQPSVNALGTELRARIQIAPLAAPGARTVQAVNPSGSSPAEPTVANQFTLVRELREDVTPIASPLVGVRVGEGASAEPARASGSFVAPVVGLVVGSAAHRITPQAGVIGTSPTLEIEGAGLQAVKSVAVDSGQGLVLGAMAVNAQGTRISVPLSVAADAPRTLRRVVLSTDRGPLAFARPGADQFLIAAPSPGLVSVEPQVVEAGKTLTVRVRGRNLSDVTGVRFEPPQGLVAIGPYTTQVGGTLLSFPVQVAADAPSGVRVLIVETAGGASAAESEPSNSFRVAQRVGPTHDAIAAPLVGLVVGAVPVPRQESMATLGAPLVGVMVQPAATASRETATGYAPAVGEVVGRAVSGMSPRSPDGLLRGRGGVITVTGFGLEPVTSVSLVGPAGVSAGVPTVRPDGREVLVPVTVAADAPAGPYGVRLFVSESGASAQVIPLVGADTWFSVGALPTAIDSISPIVLEPGKSYDFTVRGRGLRDVFAVEAVPAAGLRFEATPAWSTDALGEKLAVRLYVDTDVAPGSRVIRLRVPGGGTGADPTPANTLTVVPLQSP